MQPAPRTIQHPLSLFTLKNKSFAVLVLAILSVFTGWGQQVNLLFNLAEFGASPVTNRIVQVRPLSPFYGNITQYTSDTNGMVVIPANVGTPYSGAIIGPPGGIPFEFYVPSYFSGTNDVLSYLVSGTAQTYPAGALAWSIESSDLRYVQQANLSQFITSNTVAAAAPGNIITNYTYEFWFWTNSAGYNVGTRDNPYCVSNEISFDTQMQNLINQYSNLPVIVHLYPGTYYTVGLLPYGPWRLGLPSNWTLQGAGKYQTTVQFARTNWNGGQNVIMADYFSGYTTNGIPLYNTNLANVSVKDLTVDCNGQNNQYISGIFIAGANALIQNVRVINPIGNFTNGQEPLTVNIGIADPAINWYGRIINCDVGNVLGDYGDAFVVGGRGSEIIGCRAVLLNQTNSNWYGINFAGAVNCIAADNILINPATGFYSDTGLLNGNLIINNIFTNCLYGIEFNNPNNPSNNIVAGNSIYLNPQMGAFPNAGLLDVYATPQNVWINNLIDSPSGIAPVAFGMERINGVVKDNFINPGLGLAPTSPGVTNWLTQYSLTGQVLWKSQQQTTVPDTNSIVIISSNAIVPPINSSFNSFLTTNYISAFAQSAYHRTPFLFQFDETGTSLTNDLLSLASTYIRQMGCPAGIILDWPKFYTNGLNGAFYWNTNYFPNTPQNYVQFADSLGLNLGVTISLTSTNFVNDLTNVAGWGFRIIRFFNVSSASNLQVAESVFRQYSKNRKVYFLVQANGFGNNPSDINNSLFSGNVFSLTYYYPPITSFTNFVSEFDANITNFWGKIGRENWIMPDVVYTGTGDANLVPAQVNLMAAAGSPIIYAYQPIYNPTYTNTLLLRIDSDFGRELPFYIPQFSPLNSSVTVLARHLTEINGFVVCILNRGSATTNFNFSLTNLFYSPAQTVVWTDVNNPSSRFAISNSVSVTLNPEQSVLYLFQPVYYRQELANLIGDASGLTNLPSGGGGSGNANTNAAFQAWNPISTNWFGVLFGNGLGITNLQAANVVGTLTNPVNTTGNISGSLITGNGAGLTNLINSSTVSAGNGIVVTTSQNPNGSTNYQAALASSVTFSGTVSASQFIGDGSNLTNLLHSSTVSAGSGVTVTTSKNADGSTNYQVSAAGSGGLGWTTIYASPALGNASGYFSLSSSEKYFSIVGGFQSNPNSDYTVAQPLNQTVTFSNLQVSIGPYNSASPLATGWNCNVNFRTNGVIAFTVPVTGDGVTHTFNSGTTSVTVPAGATVSISIVATAGTTNAVAVWSIQRSP
jgi:hypothetical protein